jgi:hypothetical protein
MAQVSNKNTYHPDMDEQSHEQTYTGFLRFFELGTILVLCWVVALALGGVKAAWMTTIVGVILSSIATTIGAFAPSIGWRAPGFVLGLLLVLFLVY